MEHNCYFEVLESLLNNSLFWNEENFYICIGFCLILGASALLFFAQGCALYIHGYNFDELLWHKKIRQTIGILTGFWTLVYIVVALFCHIGIMQMALTYLFAFLFAMLAGIAASLAYNIIWHAFVAPLLMVWNLVKKKRK